MPNIIQVRRTILRAPAVVVAAGPATTTIDPAFTNGAHTLSGGDLIVTGTGGTGTSRSIASHGSGKFYFEVTIGAQFNNAFIGFVDPAFPSNFYLTSTGDSLAVYGGSSGWVGVNLTGTTTTPSLIVGHTYGLAFDATAKLAWIKDITAAGNWNANGSADPAAGTNGCDYSAGDIGISGTIHAAVTVASSGDSVTFNFGATPFAGTPPTGFGNP